MCPVVSADVRGGERLRDEPKERLRRRLSMGLLPNHHDNLLNSTSSLQLQLLYPALFTVSTLVSIIK